MAASQTIAVTGANGFLATHVVAQLLEKGYTVRGTVRAKTLENESKVAHLRALPGAEERLELVAAELLEPGAFDKVLEGCACVMHTASPYVLNVKDPQKELVDPAVEGTLNVLRSCVAAGITKCVLTSSMASVTDSPQKGHVYTEKDWNEQSSLTRNPYYFSKTEAEKAAWKFVEEAEKEGKTLKLLVANPFVIIGPEPSGSVNTSNAILRDMAAGAYPAIMNLSWAFVDVRDVAAAHLILMENADAEGRHLIINESMHMRDVVALLKEKYPEFKLPKKDMSCAVGSALVKAGSYFQDKGTGQYLRTNLGTVCLFDTAKVQALGLTYRPLRDTICDTIDDLVHHGHIQSESGKEDGKKK